MRVIDEVEKGTGGVAVCEAPAQVAPQPARGHAWALFRRRLYTSRELRHLSDRALADVGLTRAEADREARLPFWKML